MSLTKSLLFWLMRTKAKPALLLFCLWAVGGDFLGAGNRLLSSEKRREEKIHQYAIIYLDVTN